MSTISVRFDPDTKRDFETFCGNVGLNPSSAISLFVKAVLREKRIPFEICDYSDPFYSESNIKHLLAVKADVEAGRNMSVHELLEDDNTVDAVAAEVLEKHMNAFKELAK